MRWLRRTPVMVPGIELLVTDDRGRTVIRMTSGQLRLAARYSAEGSWLTLLDARPGTVGLFVRAIHEAADPE